MKGFLTTGEVARICHVSIRTAAKWIDNGLLRGWRVPGSNRRIVPITKLAKFIKENRMPESWIPK